MTGKREILEFERALKECGVEPRSLAAHEKDALDRSGYLLLPDLIDPVWLKRLRLGFDAAASDGGSAGASETGTCHVEHLAGRDEAFDRIYTHPKALAAADFVLARPFRVYQFHGREPLAGFGQQGLHTDWLPRSPSDPFVVVTTLWLLDDFTDENGPTRLVPGTHRRAGKIPKNVGDPAYRHSEQILVVAPAGTVLVFNGHLWHSATRKRSNLRRRVIQCSFIAREHSRFPAIDHPGAASLTPSARAILGV